MTSDDIRNAIDAALAPERFFVACPDEFSIQRRLAERCRWEIVLGHLLQPAQTREERDFETWNVRCRPWPEHAVVSVKFDPDEPAVYVVREILIAGHEAYEAAPNVFLSREAHKWTRELIGSLRGRSLRVEGVEQRISLLLRRAVVGLSRLPVTSWESPLPAYSLGEMAYFLEPLRSEGDHPESGAKEMLRRAFDPRRPDEAAHALDVALRSSSVDVDELVEVLIDRDASDRSGAARSFQSLFNALALTPYVGIERRLVDLLGRLAADDAFGHEWAIDVVAYQLRGLSRHLNAYDLRTFHHGGTDYPDLLLLDALLKPFLRLVERHPDAFMETQHGDVTRLRRRALREGWLDRKRYEGLRVTEIPTSPGENRRILPAPFRRLSDEELTQPAMRTKELFAGDLLQPPGGAAGEVWRAAIDDLSDERELRELGTAMFLERPLGWAKRPGEVDRTPLLTCQAFSRVVARRRLDQLATLAPIDETQHAQRRRKLDELHVAGVAANSLPAPEHPGVVSLEDALRAAPDFVFLGTTRRSLTQLVAGYEWPESGACRWLLEARDVLLIRAPGPGMRFQALDEEMNPRIVFALGENPRYFESGGDEWLADGLQLLELDGRAVRDTAPPATDPGDRPP